MSTTRVTCRLAAFLVCAISLAVCDPGKGQAARQTWDLVGGVSEGIAHRQHLPAESSDVLRCLGKDIEVADPSPYIEKFPFRLNLQDVLGTDSSARSMGRRPAQAISFWAEHPRSRREAVNKIKSSGERRVAQFTIDIDGQIPSWGVSTIEPISSEAPMILAGLGIQLPKRRENGCVDECSFVGDQALFGQASLPIRDEDQNNREYRYDRRGERRNDRIVFFNEMARTPPEDRAGEMGRNFFLLLGAVLLGCFGLALLIRR